MSNTGSSTYGAIPAARRRIVVSCAILLTLCATFTAWYSAFVSLAPYDDEGYMVWTVKSFLGGEALYDHVGTVYGPFYYLYEWLAPSVAGVAPRSHSGRPGVPPVLVAPAFISFLLGYRAASLPLFVA